MTAWINVEVIIVKEVLELASVRVSECLSEEKKNSSRVCKDDETPYGRASVSSGLFPTQQHLLLARLRTL